MPSLPELQRGFFQAIVDKAAPEFIQEIEPGRFPAAQHLNVYRNNVIESLTSALQAVYPVVTRLVSEGFFRYASAGYIAKYPPRSGNLHEFGGHFGDFLAVFSPTRELVYLPDVARLEWARHRAYHAADCIPLDFETLAAVPPSEYGNLIFRLQPSAHLITSAYPVLRIWEVNQQGYEGDSTVSLDEGGVSLLVIRRSEVEIEALSTGELALLSAIAAGRPFALAAEAALDAEPDLDLSAALARHVRLGTLVQLDLEGLLPRMAVFQNRPHE
ncbi:MAG TPA: putative DNA-binding domain-containing protein [Sulfuricaulis sp.]|nr:putative DNA-binding domain-containing protein [Sulfuricaulis sp.]